MSTGHRLFDHRLLDQRRTRAAKAVSAGGKSATFLLERAIDDLQMRLGVVQRRFAKVAVIGGHHGLLARRLREAGSHDIVIDCERTPDLLALCDEPKICQDPEAIAFKPACLDLAVSALSLQFVDDLPGTLLQIRHALRPDGLLLASLIGGESLYELRDAFVAAEAEIEGGASPRIAPFADVRSLGGLLQRAGYALPVVDFDRITVGYRNPIDLMLDLRAMGATNPLIDRSRRFLRRATLARMMQIYAEHHARPDGRVVATFDIVTLTAWAPHESQQQPLRPGSARSSLADALKTKETKL